MKNLDNYFRLPSREELNHFNKKLNAKYFFSENTGNTLTDKYHLKIVITYLGSSGANF